MIWHSVEEKPQTFMDIVVCEPDGRTYVMQTDYPGVKINGTWAYAADLTRHLIDLKDLLRTLLYELNAEASTSEDYATRKKAELLCEMIKLKLYVYHLSNKISMEILEKRLHLLEQMDNLMNLKIQF